MNNSHWGGSIPINRLLKKPNPALNKETNSHPAKPQTLAQPLLNLSCPERGFHVTAAVRGASPCALSEASWAVSSPCFGMGSTAQGALLGLLVATAPRPYEPGVSRLSPAPLGPVWPLHFVRPLVKDYPVRWRAVSTHWHGNGDKCMKYLTLRWICGQGRDTSKETPPAPRKAAADTTWIGA